MRKEYYFSRGVHGPAVPLQSLMNSALREHMPRQREPLEATLRRVVREELLNLRKASDAD